MFGFLLQWPTILTLLMFPVLVLMYTKLAFQEEREMQVKFGTDYDHYAVATPAFLPHFS
jgi:protein-S-isoprenylcysteine O-methyltransferase Ste14